MIVRPCTAADLRRLRAAWPTTQDVHGAHVAQQQDGRVTYLVAWRDDVPLGSAMVHEDGPVSDNARTAYPRAVYLNHLQVRAEFRGQGVGSRLIGAAERLARERGRAELALGVDAENDSARRLYERLGYLPTGVVDVSEYDWVDADGVVHHAVEHDELLVKKLAGPAGC